MEQKHLIYTGKLEDFCWAGFGSGSGTNLRECAKIIKPAVIFCDKPSAGLLKLEELADVPKIIEDGFKQCGSWKKAIENPKLWYEYEKRSDDFNSLILDRLSEFERKSGKNIDLIVLGGYMRFMKDPLLEAYKDRIINVHPADLSLLENGKRAYVGANAVYDAINEGEASTKSSVIMVDNLEDHGEILVQGLDVDVWNESILLSKGEMFDRYASLHQEVQKKISDWPALTTALKLIAEGRLALGSEKSFHDEWRKVYFDGKPLGYKGYQITKIE